ncbi:SCP2 sterol-binding domain-containing protein [Methylophaga sp.]|jgi:ubiquinone biosynthesis accessory factor UbiJ|uniref:ubiquinone biosynthesis accessory factor UbiJ n=1 Tax=Methylophaga sp. TaxID=2024840 RepID=UPI000C121201|nr:SCP2 sterol-binding domain-containing protein [Methylophaga sp.]MBL1456646.1 SCP2 sterol-binding domain-containing protein [Methylophaga sp.]|tara:strand:+ start:233 stop:835 length:603 start_codon:yes stop_codon:yes gene_type:complete
MSLLLKPLEIALNHALRFDMESHEKLQRFASRSIRIDITNLNIAVIARFTDDRILLETAEEHVADLMIKADSFALLKLVQQPDSLFSNQIQIRGDVQFAKQLQDWQQHFDFDWEQQLARVTGDTLAYPLAQSLRRGFDWLNYNRSEFEQSLAEYLREESQYLPDKSQTQRFMQNVDLLRADTERLEARIKRLQNLIEKKT